MQRMRSSLYSLAILSAGFTPGWSQEGDWKPAGQHTARYQGEEPAIKLGKPVRKVDGAIAPAQFASTIGVGAPLPPPPPGVPTEYEALPYPKAALTAAGRHPQDPAAPKPTLPSAAATPTETIPGLPAPGAVPGQVVGAPIYTGPILPGQAVPGAQWIGDDVTGIGVPGVIGDRYYLSAPHGAPARWYGSIDYVLWMMTNDKTPALVTTGPQESEGILGEPGVSVLYGGEIGDATLNGGRLNLGVWFNRCQTWGMMANVFTTQRRTDTFFASSPGDPLLARPFFNIDEGLEASELVAAEGLISGSVAIQHTTRLAGADLNFRFNLWNNRNVCKSWQNHLDFYAGVRWMALDEGLTITEDLLAGPDSQAPGAAFLVQDRFTTDNDFIGANLGLMSEWRWKRFFVGLRTGVAIGGTRQQVSITGSTRITPDGEAPVTQPGGLLALGTNMGTYGRNAFSVVPEFGFNLGLQVTDHCRLYVGYDLMYWTNVVRPGRQIDRVVNPTQLPTIDGPGTLVGLARPTFSFRDSNVVVHGLTAGLQWVY